MAANFSALAAPLPLNVIVQVRCAARVGGIRAAPPGKTRLRVRAQTLVPQPNGTVLLLRLAHTVRRHGRLHVRRARHRRHLGALHGVQGDSHAVDDAHGERAGRAPGTHTPRVLLLLCGLA